MPFDPHSAPAARPYMREGTSALAALVATQPERDVLQAVAAELAHRDRPAARKLRDEVLSMLTGPACIATTPADLPATDATDPAPRLVLDKAANAWVAAPAIPADPVAQPAIPLGEQLAALPPAELLRALASLPYDIRIEGLPGETLSRSVMAAGRILEAPGFEHRAEVVATRKAKIAAKRAAPAAKPARVGDTSKQRAAWAALSPERQAHMRAVATWRAAWSDWHYRGGAEPGARPVDTTSLEALDAARRDREADEAEAVRLADLARKWNGDEAARNEAARTAPTRNKGETEAAHMERIRAHMDKAAARARGERAS